VSMHEEDQDLVQRLRAGDAKAFDRLFELHRRELLAYAAGLLGDRSLAEDVVQESFLELVRCCERIDPARGVRPWLFRVTRNRAIDVLRKRAPEVRGEDAENAAASAVAEVPSPAGQAIGAEERKAVAEALGHLSARERDVLVMHYYGGLTFREIAGVVRRPLGTVLWQARRAIGRLGTILGDRAFDGRNT
jgi:RNA polymerase sigma-70 factor, ECF subfamily